MTEEFFDDIKVVMFHLRHSCVNIRTVKRTIEIIVSKTDLTQERVEAALSYIGNA